MTSLLGGSLGALYATNLGAAQPLGYEGWRFAFFSVAMLSILIGAIRAFGCERCLTHEPPTWRPSPPGHNNPHGKRWYVYQKHDSRAPQ
jgi:hypothetical protein